MLGWFGQQLRVGDGVVYEGDRPVFGLSGRQVMRALPSQYGPSIERPGGEDMSRYTPEALVGWTPPAPAAAAPITPTAPAWQPLAETLTNIWQQAGIDPTMAGINRAEELAKILTNYGITDLSKLGLRDVTYTGYEPESYGEGENIAFTGAMLPVEQTGKQLTYGDQAFGYLGGFGSSGQEEFGQQPYGLEQYLQGPDLLAWSAAGKGNVSYKAVQTPEGQTVIVPVWGSSSDWGDFREVARLAATLASAGGAGAALGASLGVTGAAAQAAVGNAILGGIASGDAKGALLGGVGGLLAGSELIGNTASQVGSSVAEATGSAALGSAASNAVTGMAAGLPGAIASGNFGDLLASGLKSLVPTGISELTGLSPQQIQGGLNIARGIESGNISQILSGANTFINSPNVEVAASAARLVSAIQSGNISAIANAARGLDTSLNNYKNAQAITAAYGPAGQASRVAEGQDVVDRATDYLGGLPTSTPAGGTTADVIAATQPAGTTAGTAVTQLTGGSSLTEMEPGAGGYGPIGTAGTAGTTTGATTGAATTGGLPQLGTITQNALQHQAAEVIARLHPGQNLSWVDQGVLALGAAFIRAQGEQGFENLLRYSRDTGTPLSHVEPPSELGDVLNIEDVVRQKFSIQPPAGTRFIAPGETPDSYGYTPSGQPVGLKTVINVTGKSVSDEEAGRIAAQTRGDEFFGASSPEELQDIEGAEGTRVAGDPGVLGSVVQATVAPFAKGAGEIIGYLGTGAEALGLRDNILQRAGGNLTSYGVGITPRRVLEQQDNIIDAISKADGALGKLAAAVSAGVMNPLGLLDWTVSEGFQELFPLGTAATIGRGLTTATRLRYGDALANRMGITAAVGTNAAMDAGESALASYQSVYNELKNRGYSDEAAASAASKSAAASGLITLFTSAVSERPIVEAITRNLPTAIGRNMLREGVFGGAEEFGQSISEQLGVSGKFDMNKALDSLAIGSLLESSTAGGISAGQNILAGQAGVGGGPGVVGGLTTGAPSGVTAGTTSTAGTDITVGGDVAPAGTGTGITISDIVGGLPAGAGADITIGDVTGGLPAVSGDVTTGVTAGPGTTADVIAGTDVVGGVTGDTTGGLPAVSGDVSGTAGVATGATAGTTTGALPTVTGDTAADIVGPGADVVTGTAGDVTTGGLDAVTAGDKTTQAGETPSDGTTGGLPTTTTTGTNPITGGDVTVTADTSTGTSTTTETNADTGTTTTTSADPVSGLSTVTQADTNSGVTTETATDTNTGASTSTQTNANTGTTTEVAADPVSNVATEVQTNSNTGTTTEVATDTNTGTTTQTETNPNAGTTTTTETNPDTGTTSQTETNSNTGTTSQTETNSNNNTATTTETNANTNTQTETNTDANTGTTTQTETNTNTNTTTQTETNSNTGITTQVETNPNTNVTTQTETNPNTNTTTTVQTNPETNTTTVTEVNTQTNVKTETTTTPESTTVVETDPNTDTKTTTIIDTNTGQTTKIVVDLPTNRVIDVQAEEPPPAGGLPTVGGAEAPPPPAVTSTVSAPAPAPAPAPATAPAPARVVAPRAMAAIGLGAQFQPYWLQTGPTMIGSELQQDPMQLAELQNIFSQISPEMMSILTAQRGQPAAPVEPAAAPPVEAPVSGLDLAGYASGGSTSSWSEMWDPLTKMQAVFAPQGPVMLGGQSQRRQPKKLTPLRQISESQFEDRPYAMARGGLPPQYKHAAPEGHNPEFITGLTGFYAQGDGTGQSDDIPAMLHEGDYVMDADTVAALGDGSSKAGRQVLDQFRTQVPHRMAVGGKAVPAQIADGEYVFPASFVSALGGGDNKKGSQMLDHMRQQLRMHKRSAPVSKIPPKAKSPIEYLSGKKQ